MEPVALHWAREAGIQVERIFDTVPLDLPNPLIHANFSVQCDRAQRRSLLSRNAPRRVVAPAVDLVRYPPGTLLEGDRSYLVLAGKAAVREQVAPWFTDLPSDLARLRDYSANAEAIDVPCLLAARFGENTWGHWILEILAKVAVAEQSWPGRFRYVVPGWITEPSRDRSYATAVLESLAAYGIVHDRLIRLGSYRAYRFAQLHDVAGLWSDGPHPGGLAALRSVTVPAGRSPSRWPRKVSALRRGSRSRAIHNAGEVEAALGDAGFASCDLSATSFIDQVRLFRQAETVVASLGSDCTSMLFAPEGTGIVTLAPAQWSDGYFIRLFQRLGLRHADVRGPSTLFGDNDPARATHFADPQAIQAALAALERPDTLVVDGEAMPRRLGDEVFRLEFGSGGNAEPFLRSEWASAETGHRWSLGASSALALPRTLLPSGAFWIGIVGMGHVHPPHLPTRPFAVVVDGVRVGAFAVIGEVCLFCFSARTSAIGEDLTIGFEHPICPSPRMLGTGADERLLGFGFRSLAIFAA